MMMQVNVQSCRCCDGQIPFQIKFKDCVFKCVMHASKVCFGSAMKARTAARLFTLLFLAISCFSSLKPRLARLANSSKGRFCFRCSKNGCFILGLRRLRGRADKRTCAPALLQLRLTFFCRLVKVWAWGSCPESIYHLAKAAVKLTKIEAQKMPVLCVGVVISFRFYYWYFNTLESFGNINCHLVMGHN